MSRTFECSRLILAAVPLLALIGCSHVPHSVDPPQLKVQARFTNDKKEDAEGEPSIRTLSVDWWAAYGDPRLNALVSKALERNAELKAARARVDEAMAATRRARASLLPSLSTGAQASRGRDYAQNIAIGNDGRATLSASWEADLSGRLSNAAEGARLDAVAAEQSWAATRWQIAFETVSAAVQQRQADELGALATARLESAERLVLLTQRKFEAGQATGFDLERTRAGVVAVRVEQEQLRRARGEATHALDVLVGQTPGTSAATPALASLAVPDWTPSRIPAELLRERPDVRAAEARFAAETARWNAAEGERFPKLVLDLSGGRQRLESAGTRITGNIFSLGAGVSLPIFDGGAIRAGIETGEARSKAARAELERTLLSALQDVENAYLGWNAQRGALTHQAEGLAVAERQLDRSRLLFEAGQVDATVVAEAEAGVLSAQAELTRTRAEAAVQWGVLAKALSGSPI
ncbi:TolC family protein [Pseudomonas aeruginosa]|uniref:TolC family protein n=1 Tax=Pseudomonas aeruginosa TaxID=287 RepID=UPI0023496AD6|nr:TolC family protein [Pseudomonas aeruginosa]MDG4084198.1 TolC family protein [Pseudomonas aeruginosa]